MLHLGWVSEAVASARGAMTPGSEIQFGPISLAFLIEAQAWGLSNVAMTP